MSGLAVEINYDANPGLLASLQRQAERRRVLFINVGGLEQVRQQFHQACVQFWADGVNRSRQMRIILILAEEIAVLGGGVQIISLGGLEVDRGVWTIVRDSSHDPPTLMDDQDSDLESLENDTPEA